VITAASAPIAVAAPVSALPPPAEAGTAPMPGPGTRPRRRPGPVVGGLAALAVAGAAAAAYVAAAGPGADRVVDRDAAGRAAAIAAATQAVTNMTTYDYRTVGADFDRVLRLATGRFATEFRTGSGDLERLITAGKARSKGTVVAAGAASYSPAHAVVLLAVDDTVNNAKVPKETLRRYRFEVTVDLVDGRWLVSELHPVP
jgi:Mce-associated membrane protein